MTTTPTLGIGKLAILGSLSSMNSDNTDVISQYHEYNTTRILTIKIVRKNK